MSTALWIAHYFLIVLFSYSGICKATIPEPKLVQIGQTGVEGLAAPFIKFIGISEVIGVAGLVLPGWLRTAPELTPVSAFCLGMIMLPAAVIHYRRGERGTAVFNSFVFALCMWVAYNRWMNL